MVVGTIVPDMARAVPPRFALIWDGRPIWWDGHAWGQALTGGLVVGLLLTWSARRLVLPRLAGYLPDLGQFHLRDLRLLGRTRHPWWIVVLCLAIGSITHLLIDLVGHTDRGVVLPGLAVHLFDIAGRDVKVATVLQVLASVGLSVFTVWEMYDIGRRRLISRWSGVEVPVPALTPSNRFAVRAVVVVAAGFSGLVGLTRVSITPAVGLMTSVVVGWVALCVIAAFVRPASDA